MILLISRKRAENVLNGSSDMKAFLQVVTFLVKLTEFYQLPCRLNKLCLPWKWGKCSLITDNNKLIIVIYLNNEHDQGLKCTNGLRTIENREPPLGNRTG